MTVLNKNVRGLSALASLVGAKSGVKVVFDSSAKTASTNGQTIYLPQFKTLGNKKEAICISALVDHEMMHLKWSDFGYFTSFSESMVSKHGERYGAFASGLLNTIEDYWGELAQAKVYPGSRMNILAGVPVLIELGFYGPVQEEPPILMAVSNMALHYLCAKCYGAPELIVFSNSHQDALKARISDDEFTQLLSLLDDADNCGSTVEASQLAEAILNLVMQMALSNEELANEIENEQVQQPKDMADRLVDAMNALAGVPSPDRDSLAESLAGLVDDHSFDYRQVSGTPFSEQEDINLLAAKFHDTSPAPFGGDTKREILRKTNKEAFRIMEDGLLEICENIRKGVIRSVSKLIEAKRYSETYFKDSGNRMNSSRLGNLAVGNFNIFERTDEADGIDTAVMLVADFSGSMFSYGYTRKAAADFSNRYATYCNALLMEVGAALAKNDMPFGIATYGDVVVDYKPFTTSWKAVKSKVPCVTNMGSTATAEALHHSILALAKRTENKRVIVLVTDGEPNSCQATLSQMIEAKHAGIHLVVLYLAAEKTQFMAYLEAQHLIECVACQNPETLCQSFAQAIKDSF